MSIIENIRKFFHLDKVTLSLDNEFTNSVGLWINERNELMKEDFGGCLVNASSSNIKHDGIVTGFHQNHITHLPGDFHCSHF